MKSEKIIKTLNFSKILKPYENKWIALSADRKQVVANGETLNAVIKKTGQNRDKLSFTKVLPFGINYAPYL